MEKMASNYLKGKNDCHLATATSHLTNFMASNYLDGKNDC